ncbi:uncharacterized protein LOC108676827, partial [Hyalella azteca]|uniref:Uncharacterized protein LOC108676827 n=1 Tax=Hyalella azteca TaxID=294128 RepID=A0A8B7P364_HYAAZ
MTLVVLALSLACAGFSLTVAQSMEPMPLSPDLGSGDKTCGASPSAGQPQTKGIFRTLEVPSASGAPVVYELAFYTSEVDALRYVYSFGAAQPERIAPINVTNVEKFEDCAKKVALADVAGFWFYYARCYELPKPRASLCACIAGPYLIPTGYYYKQQYFQTGDTDPLNGQRLASVRLGQRPASVRLGQRPASVRIEVLVGDAEVLEASFTGELTIILKGSSTNKRKKIGFIFLVKLEEGGQ